MAPITFGVLTVSDSCFAKTKEDKSGPKLEELVKFTFPDGTIAFKSIVPDEKEIIEDILNKWCSNLCNVILTTGGTGFSPRDVTPEATKAVIDKEAPGVSYAMISKSLEITNFSMLSRAVCGIKNRTLIINFPGSTKGAAECFTFVKDIIPHAVEIINDRKQSVKQIHERIQTSALQCENNGSVSKVKVCKLAERKRESPYPMLEVSKALEIVFAECHQTEETEIVDINKSLGRVLAEDVYAKDPLPPFPASIKDGYAVKSSDGSGVRRVKDVVAAGDNPSFNRLAAGEVVRISTGAAIPEGADAVVQVEDTELVESSEDGEKELKIKIKVTPAVGQDIRSIGSDIASNSLVLEKGDRIIAGHIGVLATVGMVKVKVYKRTKVGIISTGNEVQSPYEDLKPGHIRDSNKLTLLNLLKQYSFEGSDCGVARDEPTEVKRTLCETLSKNDVVVTTGGVSMGEYDLIKQILIEDFGAVIHFGRLNMKPGKPTTFATCFYEGRQKMIFGLPGNPVSATVTSILFVIPALRYLEKNKHTTFPRIPVTLGTDLRLDPRPEYVRVMLKREAYGNTLRAFPTGNQISSRINSFIGANALLILPGKNTAGYQDSCQEGAILDAYVIDALGIE